MNILISACLLGVPCRYDGKSKPCPEAAELAKVHTLIPFCPECFGGLPTPREPSEITDGRVVNRVGADVTGEYRRGAEEALKLCRMLGCGCAVLKEKSPSCGHGKIYDGTFTGTLTDGDGITAALLAENGIPVYGESDIPVLLSETEEIPFTKMHGIGNDYIYIDQIRGVPVADMSALAVEMSSRHFSIGADGAIFICPPEDPANHGRMRMFNTDGSEGKMCGNGIRCAAKFLCDAGYVPPEAGEIRIETLSGVKTVVLQKENGRCTGAAVEMGKAIFAPERIPVLLPEECVQMPLEAAGQTWKITAVSMGNPHAIVFTEDPESLPLEEIGPFFAGHPLFPEGVNAEFVRAAGRNRLEMRVWERGSGETFACGTGACAAVAAAIRCGYCDAGVPVTVLLRGGELTVTVSPDWDVTLEGPAETVYSGIWRRK
ncbi:MAG: diaminopimelate epimerase [Clostridia bacterium]|nr:diaminopimelate epimerase [Clostridia bacterium]